MRGLRLRPPEDGQVTDYDESTSDSSDDDSGSDGDSDSDKGESHGSGSKVKSHDRAAPKRESTETDEAIKKAVASVLEVDSDEEYGGENGQDVKTEE